MKTKTNKIIYRLCALCMLCVLCVSCDDYLDVTPSDKQTAAQVFASKAGFYTAANGIYDAMSSDALYGKQMTWEAVDIMSQSYVTTNSQQVYKSLAANSYTDSYAAPVLSSIWGKAYELILNCNLLIDQIDQQQGMLSSQEANACLVRLRYMESTSWPFPITNRAMSLCMIYSASKMPARRLFATWTLPRNC